MWTQIVTVIVDVERSHIHFALSLAGLQPRSQGLFPGLGVGQAREKSLGTRLAGFENGHVQVFSLAWVQSLERGRKSSGTGLRTNILLELGYPQ